jgi:hypothetical protein
VALTERREIDREDIDRYVEREREREREREIKERVLSH